MEMKKVISVLLVLVFLFAQIGCKKVQQENESPPLEIYDENFYYTLFVGVPGEPEYSISKYFGDEENVVIPSQTPNGYSVISLRLSECSTIKTLHIPDGIREFWGVWDCENLEEIYIGKDVAFIGVEIFSGCPKLSSIQISEENEQYYVEGNCLIRKDEKRLEAGCKNSVIPEDIVEIMGGAFYGIPTLEFIEIPDSVVRIGSYAFYGTSLHEIYIGENVTEMEWNIFEGISDLTIYCAAESKPDGWHDDWMAEAGTGVTVVWNCKES